MASAAVLPDLSLFALVHIEVAVRLKTLIAPTTRSARLKNV